MIRVYMAGPLFTEADKRARISEREFLEKLFEDNGLLPGVDVTIFNPVEQPINDKSTNPSALDIFYTDANALRMSDIVLACLDGEDSGVMYELGMVHNSAPYVFPYATDIRFGGTVGLKGLDMPMGINQFVVGALGGPEAISRSFYDVADKISDLIKEGVF